MESNEDDEETQASFCRFLDDNFKLPISAYAPGCVPKVKIKERLIKEIHKDRIIISDGNNGEEKVLTPDGNICFSYEIEGREWSDGCVCDGTEYTLDIIWK